MASNSRPANLGGTSYLAKVRCLICVVLVTLSAGCLDFEMGDGIIHPSISFSIANVSSSLVNSSFRWSVVLNLSIVRSFDEPLYWKGSSATIAANRELRALVPEPLGDDNASLSGPRLYYQDVNGSSSTIDTGDRLVLRGLTRGYQGAEFNLKPLPDRNWESDVLLPERWNETYTLEVGALEVESLGANSWAWSVKSSILRTDPSWEKVSWNDIDVGIGHIYYYSDDQRLIFTNGTSSLRTLGTRMMLREVYLIDSMDDYVSAGDNFTLTRINQNPGYPVSYAGDYLIFVSGYIVLGYVPLPEEFPN